MEMRIAAHQTTNVIHIMDIAKQTMIAKVLVTFVVKRIAYHLVSYKYLALDLLDLSILFYLH